MPLTSGRGQADWFYANALKNATGAQLVDDGQRIGATTPACRSPSPVGAGGYLEPHGPLRRDATQTYNTYYVDSGGDPVLATSAYSTSVFPMFRTPDELVGDKAWTMLRINYAAPARRLARSCWCTNRAPTTPPGRAAPPGST